MTIKIQRGRQFVGGAQNLALFEASGRLATWLPRASEALVGRGVAIKLGDVTLKTADEWKSFLSENASTQKKTADFKDRFGITFQDFIEVIDDAAVAADGNFTLDLTPGGKVATALSLDGMDHDYASRLQKGAKVALDVPQGATAVELDGGLEPSIGPEILAASVGGSWDRDRAEQESWADFQVKRGANRIFRDNTGPAPFAKLTDPQWKDAEAMALVEKFNLPLHLELESGTPTNPDGTPNFQDNKEMFRETYFDDAVGSLQKSGASVRARVRFDNNEPFTVRRVLVQAKEGREVDPQTGRSVVHKFEKRWEGTSVSESDAQNALMSGKDKNGSVLPVSQKLYKLAADGKHLPEDQQLRLAPKHIVLQKRRRTHLQLDSVTAVKSRLEKVTTELVALKAANQPVPAELQKFSDKLTSQVKTMEESSALLSKYGKFMPSGECFIISADRYKVYDPAARAGKPPSDLDDELGMVGEGLHVEAEWDSASSDPFTQAVEEIDKRLGVSGISDADKKTLEDDKQAINGVREQFRDDVAQTVELLKERLVGAGMEHDPVAKSKDDRAKDMMAAATNRATYWV